MLSVKQQYGFTLVEMIGVLAVIAILASVATPRIMESIEDAKVSKVIQQVKLLEGAVSTYYSDTGNWPRLNTDSNLATVPQDYQLTTNASSPSATVTGWQGPYVDTIPQNPFRSGQRVQLVEVGSTSGAACDVDGDGNKDGSFYVYHLESASTNLKMAEKISNIFDKDGGSANWKTQGRVRINSGNADFLSICLFRI